MPSYGRFQVPEPASNMAALHHYKGAALKEVDWEPRVGVLDQEDLFAQRIYVSTFIPGAKNVDALGSCTANATTAVLSWLLSQAAYFNAVGIKSYDDVVGAEEFAIKFYNLCTQQTGQRSEEWPPTDCGSSGLYVVEEVVKQGWASGAQIATGAQNVVSLLQAGPLLLGTPFLNAWEEPDASGFVDGSGSQAAVEQQITKGVAGGHEIVLSAIEKLTLFENGQVYQHETVLRFRNSWSKSWGDNGSGRIHLSTLMALGNYCDFRLLKAA